MENYDDDFSTLKGNTLKYNRPLSSWKSDVVTPADGDTTLKFKRPPTIRHLPEMDIESDDDFADEFENAISRNKFNSKPVSNNAYLPDAFVSDSSSKSTGRASLSSISSANSVDRDDEFDMDFEDGEVLNSQRELLERFKARQQRAREEAMIEAAQSKFKPNPKSTMNLSENEDMNDLDLDQLTLRVKNGTVNKNIKLQPPPSHATLRSSQSSKLLRGMRSIAQFPQHDREKEKEKPLENLRLRSAMSMMNLGESRRSASKLPPTQRYEVRPLTAYKEPVIPQTLRKTKSRTLNLIRNPLNSLQRQEKQGMVLNPLTGMWEGNEQDISKFEEPAKPKLITKNAVPEHDAKQKSSGMVFDNKTLSWVYANEADYDDPFANIDDDQESHQDSQEQEQEQEQDDDFDTTPVLTPNASPMKQSKKVRIDSLASSLSSASSSSASSSKASQFGRSSVVRSENSGREVFDVNQRVIAEWKYADQRFMRKFGKWIGGIEEKKDTLMSDQQFYEMVRNA